MNTEIESRYLFNFSDKEKEDFRVEQEETKHRRELYRTYIREAIKNNLPTFIADNPTPFSKLDVKYQINRLALNDPVLTSLVFDKNDEIAGNDDARKIAEALKTNTNCKRLEFIRCGFTDSGVNLILDSLENHSISYLSLIGNPISMRTFQRINKMTQDPKNQWKSVDLGEIAISNTLARTLKQNASIRFRRLVFDSLVMGLPFGRTRDE